MISLDFSEGDKKTRKKREPRREHDAYMTPASLVEAIVTRIAQYVPLHMTKPLNVLEPSCGDGEFIASFRRMWATANIVGIDVRPEVEEKVKAAGATYFLAADFLGTPKLPGVDLIAGNPPFASYTAFVGHALDGMRQDATLAFLSRVNMLVGSVESQTWWTTPRDNGLSPNRQIVDVLPIFPRPSFTGGGTDATEYGLIIYRKGFDNGGRFEPIRWDKPTAKRGRKPRGTRNPETGDCKTCEGTDGPGTGNPHPCPIHTKSNGDLFGGKP